MSERSEDPTDEPTLSSSRNSVDNSGPQVGPNLLYAPGESIFGLFAPTIVARGWSVFPQERDGARRPGKTDDGRIAWSILQDRLPTPDEIAAWSRQCATLNIACVLGPASGNVFCLDVDCLDAAVSERIAAIASEILGRTPLTRIGRAPKVALLYRYPDGTPPRNRAFDFAGRDDCKLEVLSKGKALTIHGLHHVTGRWFVWPDLNPTNSGPEVAPEVHPDRLRDFLAEVGREFPFKTKQPAATGAPRPGTAGGAVSAEGLAMPARAEGERLTDGREAYLRDLAWEAVRLNGHALLRAQGTGGLDEASGRVVGAVIARFEEECEMSGRWTDGLPQAAQARVGSAVLKLVEGEMTPAPERAAKPALLRDRIDLRRAFQPDLADLDFALPGLMSGTVGVLVSAGGTGKSMLSLGLAACVATGRNLWNLLPRAPQQGKVIMVSAEDHENLVLHRVRAMGRLPNGGALLEDDPAFFENMIVKGSQGSAFSLGVWGKTGFLPSPEFETLRAEIAAERPRLVFFDTLNRCLAGIPENDNGALGRIIVEIESILSPVGAAGILLHHVSKAASRDGADEQQAARGAGAITDNARWQSNLIGMTAEEAEERGIAEEDRQRWVRWVVTKSNGELKPPEKWLRKETKGVLVAAEPPAKQTKKEKLAERCREMTGPAAKAARRARAVDDE